PLPLDRAFLHTAVAGLVEVREVRLDLQGEAHLDRFAAEVGDVQVLVHAFADVAGDEQFDGFLRCFLRRTVATVDGPGGDDVVAEPAVLLDARLAHRKGLAPAEPAAVAAEQPGTVNEQPAL